MRLAAAIATGSFVSGAYGTVVKMAGTHLLVTRSNAGKAAIGRPFSLKIPGPPRRSFTYDIGGIEGDEPA